MQQASQHADHAATAACTALLPADVPPAAAAAAAALVAASCKASCAQRLLQEVSFSHVVDISGFGTLRLGPQDLVNLEQVLDCHSQVCFCAFWHSCLQQAGCILPTACNMLASHNLPCEVNSLLSNPPATKVGMFYCRFLTVCIVLSVTGSCAYPIITGRSS